MSTSSLEIAQQDRGKHTAKDAQRLVEAMLGVTNIQVQERSARILAVCWNPDAEMCRLRVADRSGVLRSEKESSVPGPGRVSSLCLIPLFFWIQ
jgi:uncharacterized protein (DUF488 family)